MEGECLVPVSTLDVDRECLDMFMGEKGEDMSKINRGDNNEQ